MATPDNGPELHFPDHPEVESGSDRKIDDASSAGSERYTEEEEEDDHPDDPSSSSTLGSGRKQETPSPRSVPEFHSHIRYLSVLGLFNTGTNAMVQTLKRLMDKAQEQAPEILSSLDPNRAAQLRDRLQRLPAFDHPPDPTLPTAGRCRMEFWKHTPPVLPQFQNHTLYIGMVRHPIPWIESTKVNRYDFRCRKRFVGGILPEGYSASGWRSKTVFPGKDSAFSKETQGDGDGSAPPYQVGWIDSVSHLFRHNVDSPLPNNPFLPFFLPFLPSSASV